jgi:glycosyltransferase involved in cell wall biosynthesis
MASEPLVSVVIAAYNYARFVGSAVKSALGQTLFEIEVIVVDDGSTDDTEDVLRPYLADARFHFVKTENRGQPAAENTGIRMARANYVAFLDADDLWLPTKLEKQLALFHRDPDLGVAYTRRLLIDDENYLLEYRQPELYRGHVLERLFLNNFIPFPSSMVSRRVFDTVGLFNEKTRQVSDYEYWLRVAPRFRFDYVDEALLLNRSGHGSLKEQGRPYYLALEIMKRFLDEQGGRELVSPATVRRALSNTYAHLAFAVRGSSRSEARRLFLRSLAHWPASLISWRGLATLYLPESFRRQARRLQGNPVDWRPRRSGGRVDPDFGCVIMHEGARETDPSLT